MVDNKTSLSWDMLSGCSGCEMALLDVGSALPGLLETIELVHMPFLLDNRDIQSCTLPPADVGILSGCIRTDDDILRATEVRRQCRTVVALGTCAAYGGVPALANLSGIDSSFDGSRLETDSFGVRRCLRMPSGSDLTDRVWSLNEVVDVDMVMPGCPPTSDEIASLLTALGNKSTIIQPDRSVCDDCPTVRLARAAAPLKRLLAPADTAPVTGAGKMRCLLEQGYLCMGPVTRAGCGGADRIPCCVAALMPCRGCFGPLRVDGNPLVDIISALSAIGLDARAIEDRLATFDRYAGLTGRARPRLKPSPSLEPKMEKHA